MSSTIFSSNTSQQKWAEKLNDHFIVYVENPPSIFQVPKSISDTNPEAYAPQEIGIGPYHHFRRDLDDMESRKLGAIKTFLKPEQLHNFKSLVVDKVRALEPSIRSCYDKYLDLDSDTLAWAMAIDGVFLLHLLSKYKPSGSGISPDGRKLAQDVLMMENQLPSIVLSEIRKALFQPPKFASLDQHIEEEGGEKRDLSMVEEFDESKDREKLLSEMSSFCISHSVFDDIRLDSSLNSPHILDLMYRLVVLKLSRKEPISEDDGAFFLTLCDIAAECMGLSFLKLVENLPYEEFSNLFGNAKSSKNSSIQEIKIPSVSQLHRAAKIQFENSRFTGCTFKYVEDTRTLYLPLIRLSTDSEVILKNLVAYESALGSNDNVVSGFVDFMCGLIDTAKDVDFLKKKGIIETELPSGEVAKIFNGINKSRGMIKDLEQITEDMNKAYDSTLRVRCSRFVKNHLIPSVNSVKLVLWILLLSLLVLQAFCQIYGCSEHWFT